MCTFSVRGGDEAVVSHLYGDEAPIRVNLYLSTFRYFGLLPSQVFGVNWQEVRTAEQ